MEKNPFKLWGSYAGAILIFLMPFPFFLANIFKGLTADLWIDIIIGISVIIGFFLGYWTHRSFLKSRGRGIIVGIISLILSQAYLYFMANIFSVAAV